MLLYGNFTRFFQAAGFYRNRRFSLFLCFYDTFLIDSCNLFIGRFIGTVSDETLKQAETERDNAQKSIDKKKNEINSIYQKIASSQKQISKIESSMSTLTDNLSRVLPEHMSEELERWTR